MSSRSTKRILHSAALLLAFFLLAGCTATPPSSQNPSPSSGPGALPVLQELTVCTADQCYIQSRIDSSDDRYLTKIDLYSGRQQVVCAKPGCLHKGKGCWGWVRPNHAAAPRLLRILTDGEQLYWIWESVDNGTPGIQPYSAVFVSGLEGAPAPPEEWLVQAPNYCGAYQQDNDCIESQWFTDGQNLWVFQHCEPLDAAGHRCFPASLCRLVPNEDPDGPPYRAECVWRQDIGAYGEYLGLLNGKILLRWSLRADGTPARREDGYAATRQELRLLSPDGTLSAALQQGALGDTRAAALLDGVWYTVPAGSDHLQATDLCSGHTRTVCALPLESDADLIDLLTQYDGRLVVSIARENREDGYVVNTATGTLTPMQATWSKNGATPRLPILYAQSGARGLLMVGTRDRMIRAMGPDGSTDTFDSPIFLWAVTDVGDWLDGNQNWQPCTLLIPDADLSTY